MPQRLCSVGSDPPVYAASSSSISERPYPLCCPNGSSAATLLGSVVSFPSLSTPAPGGSCLPSRTNCCTRPIATTLVAQSMQIGKPIASCVGKPHECGLVPSVGNFPPNGTTSASAAVQHVYAI